jgi:uncharacterized protein YukJ
MGKHRGKKGAAPEASVDEPHGPSLKKTKGEALEDRPKKKHAPIGEERMRYGVLKGRAIKKKLGDKRSAHYRITVKASRQGDGASTWEVRVDVRSAVGTRVLFHADADVTRCSKDRAAIAESWIDRVALLSTLPTGWNALEQHRPGVALDYAREKYVDRAEMTELPFEGSAASDDIRDEVDFWISRAIAQKADFYVFGSRFDRKKGHGVHDVHFNQGNAGVWKEHGGPYRDGAIVIHFSTGRTVALFFAFAVQSWDLDGDAGA